MFIKPLPHPIQVALDKMGSSDFVMVGNSTHDAVAARAAGGYFILHNTDKHEEITLKIIRPDAIINSLYELPKAVQKIN
jgi:phosphoglycolate phosphatase-like HAD superfamily hydrolase